MLFQRAGDNRGGGKGGTGGGDGHSERGAPLKGDVCLFIFRDFLFSPFSVCTCARRLARAHNCKRIINKQINKYITTGRLENCILF